MESLQFKHSCGMAQWAKTRKKFQFQMCVCVVAWLPHYPTQLQMFIIISQIKILHSSVLNVIPLLLIFMTLHDVTRHIWSDFWCRAYPKKVFIVLKIGFLKQNCDFARFSKDGKMKTFFCYVLHQKSDQMCPVTSCRVIKINKSHSKFNTELCI